MKLLHFPVWPELLITSSRLFVFTSSLETHLFDFFCWFFREFWSNLKKYSVQITKKSTRNVRFHICTCTRWHGTEVQQKLNQVSLFGRQPVVHWNEWVGCALLSVWTHVLWLLIKRSKKWFSCFLLCFWNVISDPWSP